MSAINGLFPDLNEFFNVDKFEELAAETFYAMALAYNDKICGRKREKFSEMDRTVYDLSEQEKLALRSAYRTRTDGIDEDTVIKLMSKVCCRDVSDCLKSAGTYSEKIEQLHLMAVEAALSNKNIGKRQVKDKCFDQADKLSSTFCKDRFAEDCRVLDTLAKFENDDRYKGALSLQPREKQKEIAEKSAKQIDHGVACEFTYMRQCISCAVNYDAHTKAVNLAQNQEGQYALNEEMSV